MLEKYNKKPKYVKIGIGILFLSVCFSCNDCKERNKEKIQQGTFLAEKWKELLENSDDDLDVLIAECKTQAMAYNFNEAHVLLHKLEGVFKKTYIGDWSNDYNEVYDYVFEAEAIYLCAKGDKESSDRLVFLLTSVPLKGTGLPNGFEYQYTKRDGYEYARFDISDEQIENHNLYVCEVLRYNKRCDKLIDLAISNKQWVLANRILYLFKDIPSLVIEQEGQHAVVYSKLAINNAKKKIDQAKKEIN